MPWTPVECPEQLVGRHETSSFDWKQTYNFDLPTTTFEVAKDVAALASAMGGTVLVGGVEGGGERRGMVGRLANVELPGRMVTQISDAVRQHTRPLPVFEPRVITLTPAEQSSVLGRDGEAQNVSVVAVNVQPLPFGPVAVRACDDTGRVIANAYRFPIRGGEGTRFLQPEELALHYSAHERKISVLLHRIPKASSREVPRPEVRVIDMTRQGLMRQLVTLDEERMMVIFGLSHVESNPGPESGPKAHVPYAFVSAVWQDEFDVWSVHVNGFVFGHLADPTRPQFMP